MKRNPHVAKLQAGYLFPEIQRRTAEFRQKNPGANLISLGIGDTTEPLPAPVVDRMKHYVQRLGTLEGYSGYGLEEGSPELRRMIAHRLYQDRFTADEIFISDGINCDLTRLQILFGSEASVAVQDPAYPAYVDGSVLIGQTGFYSSELAGYQNLSYLPCSIENDFFPDLSKAPRTDLIYFCSPNNPTGAMANYEQLTKLVQFAKRNRSILIFDAAYTGYVRDPKLPRSIFDIPGAREVAIEVGSFSKMAGFTGVRLGWSVVPKELLFDDGSSVGKDWLRLVRTLFNGASNISQAGGMACLEDEGWNALQERIDFYMENTALICAALRKAGHPTYGGEHSPFVWVHFPKRKSWEVFDQLLEKCHLITLPGAGFGPAGEGFIRMSAFGHRSTIEEAAERLLTGFC